MRFSIRTPPDFDFWKTIYSHGWCSLAPFTVDTRRETFRAVLALSDQTVYDCRISYRHRSLAIEAHSASRMTASRRIELRTMIEQIFRLEENLREFYRRARTYPEYRWIARMRAGRMLRASTAFEDIIMMICTTNCNWSLTTIMVENLCNEFGLPATNGVRSFPSPESIAGSTERVLRQKIRAGYRAPYLLAFAEQVASKKIDPEGFRTSPLATPDLLNSMTAIKGIGPYAAENLLRLFGRYDYLALDSWVRAKYSELHHRGRKVSDRTIQRRYARFGKWRGLFFWLEMTRDWYDEKFPL
ncbi:MAG: Fe-S cluster assembly protein HesB [Ignavibacteria bacterium]|nr:Fe-S cluster assembly protein HesB [Ignavibacteria bacterium]